MPVQRQTGASAFIVGDPHRRTWEGSSLADGYSNARAVTVSCSVARLTSTP
jgi:hypothetical protein